MRGVGQARSPKGEAESVWTHRASWSSELDEHQEPDPSETAESVFVA